MWSYTYAVDAIAMKGNPVKAPGLGTNMPIPARVPKKEKIHVDVQISTRSDGS